MAFKPEHAVVWTEIPVRDLDAARRFYETVFDWEMVLNEDGPNPILMFPTTDEMRSVAGHLYPGEPAPRGGDCSRTRGRARSQRNSHAAFPNAHAQMVRRNQACELHIGALGIQRVMFDLGAFCGQINGFGIRDKKGAMGVAHACCGWRTVDGQFKGVHFAGQRYIAPIQLRLPHVHRS